MGHHRRPSFSSSSASCLFFLIVIIILPFAHSSGVFEVRRKFNQHHPISDFKTHDAHRHARMLSVSSVDIPLGGNGLPTTVGLYYTDLAIGTPAKKFTVQVDTGSDILWVNCVDCHGCPTNSSIGIEMSTYDSKGSNSSSILGCNEQMCSTLLNRERSKCPQDMPCNFRTVYGDGSSSSGYFVTDLVNYNKVSGDHQTRPGSGNVSFGCTAKQTGASTVGIEGLLGFGQANSSMISQLASSGKVRKVFSHCLDTVKGGGIFAIGSVVEPIVTSTPLVPNMPHYNVNMKAVEVGNNTLPLPTNLFESQDNAGTIIDSGTTLAYLPDIAYKLIRDKIFFNHPNLKIETVGDIECFEYEETRVDEDFPVVKFHFENSVTLQVNPKDYLFPNQHKRCVGWQNGGDRLGFLLGDLVLANKLVVYDLENQTVGWTSHNCSTSIKVEDDTSKATYIVNAHTTSSASRLEMGQFIGLLPLTFLVYLLISSSQIHI